MIIKAPNFSIYKDQDGFEVDFCLQSAQLIIHANLVLFDAPFVVMLSFRASGGVEPIECCIIVPAVDLINVPLRS